ncbi:MAG: DUF1192 domain-containing protein [Pseudomonadota bacterium]
MSEDEPEITSPAKLDLELLSEDELTARIADLEAEIEACKAELAKKQAHKSAASALFGGD